MGANLYFMSGDRAVEMSEHRYDSESTLQKIIADNPNLLLRDSDSDESRLMMVVREFKMAESDDSSNTYCLDHLFVDQSGVPVLVEVKRSTDTRTRREVVAQMLDYASRVSTWNANDMRKRFHSNYEDDEELLALYDTDEFWMQVSNYLKAERVKLVFVADRIPTSLKTLIEFMDRNMEDIEVYGVELRQYKTDEATMLTSNIVGTASVNAKCPTPRISIEWDAASLASYLLSHHQDDIMPVIDDLTDYANSLGLTCVFGHGSKFPSCQAKLGKTAVFSVSSWWRKTKGYISTASIFVPDILERHKLAWDEKKLRNLICNMPGRAEAEAAGLIWHPASRIYIELHVFLNEDNLLHFKKAIKEICDAISNCQANSISDNIQ